MTLQVPIRKTETELYFRIQLKRMTDEETRAYYRKKLYELSLKSLGEIAQLEEPTKQQSRWVERKMKAPASSWTWRLFE